MLWELEQTQDFGYFRQFARLVTLKKNLEHRIEKAEDKSKIDFHLQKVKAKIDNFPRG